MSLGLRRISLVWQFPRGTAILTLHVRRFHASAITWVKDPSVLWFHAIDIAKSKPCHINYKQTKPANKYVPFSPRDSARLEESYQQSLDRVNETTLVPAKEDGLFQVSLEKRELRPTYWNGPVYDVRRGTWFYSNPTLKLSPCPETLSAQLEELYLELLERFESKEDTYDGEVIPLEYKEELTSTIVNGVKFASDLDSGVAWLYKADRSILGKIASLGNQKVVRGYRDDDDKKKKNSSSASTDKKGAPSSSSSELVSRVLQLFSSEPANSETKVSKQMENDYNATDLTDRPIDHLVLCVHGIGQKLNSRIESVNFVHDINVFRKVMKEVFCDSQDLQSALNANSALISDKSHPLKTNNRVQVLPVIWRHNIEFGTPRILLEDKNTITLEDVNVQSLTPLRNLIGDVVVDVLLYKDPTFREQILDTVIYNLNKIVRQFIANNPVFSLKPKISIIGHSLGSVICFDLLTTRKSAQRPYSDKLPISREHLEFDVNAFFTMGSPLGLFQLIKQENIISDKLNAHYLYNIFHPSDPISYRIEPLIHPQTYSMTPAVIPFAKGGISTGIQDLSEFGQKISQATTAMWNGVATLYSKADWLEDLKQRLGDDKKKLSEPEKNENKDDEKELPQKIPEEVQREIKTTLEQFNPTGRVDYSLQEGVLDISLITAIGAHISYFENPDVAKFVLTNLYKD